MKFSKILIFFWKYLNFENQKFKKPKIYRLTVEFKKHLGIFHVIVKMIFFVSYDLQQWKSITFCIVYRVMWHFWKIFKFYKPKILIPQNFKIF